MYESNFLDRWQALAVVKHGASDEAFAKKCEYSVDPAHEDLKKRISGVDMVAVSATYHKKCRMMFVNKLWKSDTVPVSSDSPHGTEMDPADAVVETPYGDVAPVAGIEMTVSVLQVTDCGRALSHEQYLRNVAMTNGLQFLQTTGAGNCFFHVVSLGLLHHGMQHTVQELREQAATELEINRHIYEGLYQVEDHKEHEQAEAVNGPQN